MKIAREIQRSLIDRPFHNPRRFGTKTHAVEVGKLLNIRASHLCADPSQRPNEIFDHAVRLGVIDIEAIELAVADEIDAGLLLGGDDHPRRIDDGLSGG